MWRKPDASHLPCARAIADCGEVLIKPASRPSNLRCKRFRRVADMSKVFNESFIETGCYRSQTQAGRLQCFSPTISRRSRRRHRSPGLQPDAVQVIVIVPTFRRPAQILETLASLQRQQTARRFAVILIENEAEKREGAVAATPLFESGEIAGMVIVAHERGNCSAYNAGLETALANFPYFTWLAIIDDDEIADPQWLERHVRGGRELWRRSSSAGPQIPVFPASQRPAVHRPSGLRAAPTAQSGPVAALYSSGNLLISRDVLAAMGAPFLDLRFNFMGGGDSDFLSRAAANGLQARMVRGSAGARDGSGAPAGSRLDPLAQPAQRRHLDAGREEEARRPRRSAICASSPRAWRCLPPRRSAASSRLAQHRLAVDRHLSRLCRDRPRACGIRLCQ